MSTTLISDVANQVQTFWSPLFMDELKESSILAGLVNKEYQNDLKKAGDTVRVSQINRPTATLKTVGAGHDTFSSSKLSTSYVDIKADTVISASYEFDDLVEIQSQIADENSKVRQSLMEAMEIKLNDYLYSLVSPSLSTPDHLTASVADFNSTALNNVRTLASKAKWARLAGWYGLTDPQYSTDMLNSTPLVSSDTVGAEFPMIGGQIVRKRAGFNLVEDNSDGLIDMMNRVGSSTATADAGLFFHPDFMHLVMQMEPEFKIAELTSNHQFGFVIVARLFCGAKVGIDGAIKHVVVYNS